MRVLSVIHYPFFGGPHNRNMRLIPLMRKRGIETLVLLPDEPGNAATRLREAGIEVKIVPLHRIRKSANIKKQFQYFSEFWKDVHRIQEAIRKNDIDLVQINGMINPQAALAAKRAGVRVVWQVLDTMTPKVAFPILMPLIKRYADAVMCTGWKVAQMHYGLPRLKDRLVLFYPPVNIDQFRSDSVTRARVRSYFGFNERDTVIGNIGKLCPPKGHFTFIRGAALIKKAVPNVRFIILGGKQGLEHEKYAEKLVHEAKELGLVFGQDFIIADPGNRVDELAQSFDIFWLTSIPKSEGVPTVVEEAMALSLPIVSTEVGSVSEIVKNDVTGYLVPSNDYEALISPTISLIKNPERARKIGLECRRQAENLFSLEACSKKHIVAYETALSNRL